MSYCSVFGFFEGRHVWQYCFEIGWKTAIYICGNNMILRLASEASHLWFAFARCQGSFCLRKKTSNALRKGNQKRYQIMKMLICTKGFGELTCVMYFVPSASSQYNDVLLVICACSDTDNASQATQGNTSCLENIVIFREGKQTETEFSNRVPSSI